MEDQMFLVTVQRMCTSDEADVVCDWTAIVAEKDLDKIGPMLPKVAEFTAMILKDFPGTNRRPMTVEEIMEWRGDEAKRAADIVQDVDVS